MSQKITALLARRTLLEREIAAIDAEVKVERNRSRKLQISNIVRMMREAGITATDLPREVHVEGQPSEKDVGIQVIKRGTAGIKVAAKYHDPETGNSWTGRGMKPNWLSSAIKSGRTLESFKV